MASALTGLWKRHHRLVAQCSQHRQLFFISRQATFFSLVRVGWRGSDPGQCQDRPGLCQGPVQIAIQALLTGHLVLATLHTNDAASAVTRLTDMGIEPFLLSSSLLGVLAQRLLRKLCTQCHGAGCAACGQTGYLGRTGVFELLVTNDAIRAQIHHQASEADIRAAAVASGMALMREDGERLVHGGITSREERVRVTRD